MSFLGRIAALVATGSASEAAGAARALSAPAVLGDFLHAAAPLRLASRPQQAAMPEAVDSATAIDPASAQSSPFSVARAPLASLSATVDTEAVEPREAVRGQDATRINDGGAARADAASRVEAEREVSIVSTPAPARQVTRAIDANDTPAAAASRVVEAQAGAALTAMPRSNREADNTAAQSDAMLQEPLAAGSLLRPSPTKDPAAKFIGEQQAPDTTGPAATARQASVAKQSGGAVAATTDRTRRLPAAPVQTHTRPHVPQAAAALKSTAASRGQPVQPAVHIGSIDIIVEAPPAPAAAPTRASPSGSSFASGHYLRSW